MLDGHRRFSPSSRDPRFLYLETLNTGDENMEYPSQTHCFDEKQKREGPTHKNVQELGAQLIAEYEHLSPSFHLKEVTVSSSDTQNTSTSSMSTGALSLFLGRSSRWSQQVDPSQFGFEVDSSEFYFEGMSFSSSSSSSASGDTAHSFCAQDEFAVSQFAPDSGSESTDFLFSHRGLASVLFPQRLSLTADPAENEEESPQESVGEGQI